MENVKRDQKKQFYERPRIYLEELLTKNDLADFKSQLLFEIKNLLKEQSGQPIKKWLKSREVRKFLNISPGTLQNLRSRGILPFTRIGSVIYYDSEEIKHMLEAQKHTVV